MIEFSYTIPGADYGHLSRILKQPFDKVFAFIKKVCEITPSDTEKGDLHRFIPSVFSGSRRLSEEFEYTQLIGMDFDHGDVDLLFENLGELDCSYFMYETSSSTEEDIRLRIIFELAEPILKADDFKSIYRGLMAQVLPGVEYDKNCVDRARLFYIPNCTKLDSFYLHEGEPLKLSEKSPEVKVSEEINILSKELDDFARESMESIETVAYKIGFILEYAASHNIEITKDYAQWRDLAFACVSLHKNNRFPRSDCLGYFIKLSKLDGKRCDPEDKLIEYFDEKWNNSMGKHTVATIYYLAKEAGIPLPKRNPETIYLVKGLTKGTNYLAKPNSDTDDIVELHREEYIPNVARGKIWVKGPKDYAFEESDIFHWEEDKDGKKKRSYNEDVNKFLARFEKHPDKYIYRLGFSHKGHFYEKSTDTLITANHCLIPTEPVFHQKIHDWLNQLEAPEFFLSNYLYYLSDLTRALPLLFFYGVAGGGKTTFFELCASLWGTGAVKDFFGDFNETAGSNPMVLFDEDIPNKPGEIKSLITSYITSIKRKYHGATYLEGFQRVGVAVNFDKPYFPSKTKNDETALLRRMHAVKFTEANRDYFESIGGFETVNKWMALDFRQHVAFIRENKNDVRFNIGCFKTTDIIALPPIGNEDMKESTFNFNEEDANIVEAFFTTAYDPASNTKEAFVSVEDFRKKLLEDRVVFKMVSVGRIERVIKKSFGGKGGILRRDSLRNMSRWRIRRDIVNDVVVKLGIEFKEIDEEGVDNGI